MNLSTRSICDACRVNPATIENEAMVFLCAPCASYICEFPVTSDASPKDVNAPAATSAPMVAGATISRSPGDPESQDCHVFLSANAAEAPETGPCVTAGETATSFSSLNSFSGIGSARETSAMLHPGVADGSTASLAGQDSGDRAERRSLNSVSDGGLAAPRETEMEPLVTSALSPSEDAPCEGSQAAVTASQPVSLAAVAVATTFESSPAPAMAEDDGHWPATADPADPVAVTISDAELDLVVSSLEAKWLRDFPELPAFLDRRNVAASRTFAASEIAPIFSASPNGISKSVSTRG
jgi:hypothetical protein